MPRSGFRAFAVVADTVKASLARAEVLALFPALALAAGRSGQNSSTCAERVDCIARRSACCAVRRNGSALQFGKTIPGEIFAWFQPQIDTDAGAISGFEASTRWRFPKKGVLPPRPSFSKVIGLMHKLGEVIIPRALRDAMLGPGVAGRNTC